MEQLTLWKRLKKHYILLLTGLSALLLLILLGIYQVMHAQRTTPIAHISPQDSVKTLMLPGKLERYKKELVEQEKEAYKRKVALDEIIAMDFSQETNKGKTKEFRPSKEATQPLKNLKEKEEINKTVLPKATSVKKPFQRKSKALLLEREASTSGDGFYTVKSADRAPEIKGEYSPILLKAQIHGDQKVKAAATVCLRLMEEAALGKQTYPNNTILYGRIMGGINGRLQIAISQIKGAKVNLAVYDQDYTAGIAYQMKETVNEIARESRDDAFNEALSSLPYGGVAGGLAQLGRNAVRRTKRMGTIYLADGYQVFIAPAKEHSQK